MEAVGLDEIANKPELANELSEELSRLLMGRAVVAMAALNSRAFHKGPPQDTASDIHGDRAIDVEECARRLSVPADWIYRHWRKLPFGKKIGGHIRFSELGLERYLQGKARA